MSLRKTIEVITHLEKQGAIARYAIAGAIAALNYIQPTISEDLDILISTKEFEKRKSGLLLLTPIETALQDLGYTERSGVGYLIEGWPVQFLPVSNPLDEEALEQAVEVEITLPGEKALKARVLRAEHIVATALRLGRPKDIARIDAFLEQKAVDPKQLRIVLANHHLLEAWRSFCAKYGKTDPLAR